MKKIKVLHIANGDDCLGSAKCLYDILNYEMKSNDISPIVLNPMKNKMNEYCDNNSIENYSAKFCDFVYPFHDNLGIIKYPLRKIEYFKTKKTALDRIEKLIDLDQIDIIHTNNCGIDIGTIISKKYRIPHVWHLREHGFKQFNFKPYFKDAIQYMIDNPLTSFVAVSNNTKKEWINLGIPSNRIHLSYDGVEYKSQIDKSKKNTIIKFVMCGAVSSAKGVDLVVKAFSKLSSEQRKMVSLDLWGTITPNFKKHIFSLIKDNNLEDVVKYNGFTDDIWKTLADYDVGINCTTFEAFGRCTVEYLMSGMPVLAANTGANTEIVVHLDNGFIFNRNSIESLKQGIVHFIESINMYQNKSIQLKKNAIQCFSADASSQRFTDILKSTINK